MLRLADLRDFSNSPLAIPCVPVTFDRIFCFINIEEKRLDKNITITTLEDNMKALDNEYKGNDSKLYVNKAVNLG